MEDLYDDLYFMRRAIEEAKIAFQKDEVPVGAVIVSNNQIIARAHNLTETLNDVTAHAEMQAITSAANYIGGKYLNDCTLYVTLEPCQMCAGALYWSQISKIVIGASDNHRGFRVMKTKIHPKTKIIDGILSAESKELIDDFFKKKEDCNKKTPSILRVSNVRNKILLVDKCYVSRNSTFFTIFF